RREKKHLKPAVRAGHELFYLARLVHRASIHYQEDRLVEVVQQLAQELREPIGVHGPLVALEAAFAAGTYRRDPPDGMAERRPGWPGDYRRAACRRPGG